MTRLLFHVPYVSSLRNVLQTGFLDHLMDRNVTLSLVGPSAPAEDQCPHESDVLNALLKASRARASTSPTCVNASRAWLP